MLFRFLINARPTCRVSLCAGSRSFCGAARVDSLAVELVYFDIHARGELTRLCYAAHVAHGGQQSYTDTRLPFFMDSDANQRLCAEVHRPASPYGFFPYLKVTDMSTGVDGAVRTLSGDGVIESFVAQRLGLMGENDLDAATCATVAHNAVALATPQLTQEGLHGNHQWIVESVQPMEKIGLVLNHLERYVGMCSNASSNYIIGDRLTVADLSIFNAIDECLWGPRGKQLQVGVEHQLQKHYPRLMQTYETVATELAAYIIERQGHFLHVK